MIQHGNNNKAEEEDKVLRLGDHIQWYVANRHNVLLVYDGRLADFDITTVHKMSRNQQRQWVKNFGKAREVYALKLRQSGHNQHLITKYMVPTDKLVHDTLESDFRGDIGGNHDVMPPEQDPMTQDIAARRRVQCAT